jgi:hypothetical protein
MLAANWGCSPLFKQRGEVGFWRSGSSIRRRKCRVVDPTRKLKDGHRLSGGLAARYDATAIALRGPLTLPDSPPPLGLGSVSLPLNKLRSLRSALERITDSSGTSCRVRNVPIAVSTSMPGFWSRPDHVLGSGLNRAVMLPRDQNARDDT